MAVIGKIREKSVLLLIVIALAMFAFILSDFLTSGKSMFQETNVGEIAGDKIDVKEFQVKVDNRVTNWEATNQQTATSELRESIQDQTWNEIINDKLYGAELSELGLHVGSDELFDLVQGDEPHQYIKQQFTNQQTGAFDVSIVKNFLSKMNDPGNEQQLAQWLEFENAIAKDQQQKKYNQLISKGLYVTKDMAKYAYKSEKTTYDVAVVRKQFFTLPDSSVSYTDADLKAYYDAHKSDFEQEAYRELDMVKFNVVPSAEDREEVRHQILEVRTALANSDNDSSFVLINSDERVYDGKNYRLSSLPAGLDSSFFYSEPGAIAGPFELPGSFEMTKLSAVKMIPDSVRASHILIKTTNPYDSTGYVKLDSIRNLVNGGADFAELAKKVSEDVGSAIEGGDLKWFTEGRMVPEFNDASFNGNVGDMPIVLSQFGWHLIQITDQSEKSRCVNLAKIVRNITPSSETYDKYFADATLFYGEHQSVADFEKAKEKFPTQFFSAKVSVADKKVEGVDNSKSLVKWAFNNDKGEVSEPDTYGDAFVVVCLKGVHEKGIASLEEVKEDVIAEVIKEKKAEVFASQLKGTDIQSIASAVNERVNDANQISFSSGSIPGIGYEPKLLGKIASMSKGNVSSAVVGNDGVYVVSVKNKMEAPESKEYSEQMTKLDQQMTSKSYQVFDALKEKFGVEDKRYLFY